MSCVAPSSGNCFVPWIPCLTGSRLRWFFQLMPVTVALFIIGLAWCCPGYTWLHNLVQPCCICYMTSCVWVLLKILSLSIGGYAAWRIYTGQTGSPWCWSACTNPCAPAAVPSCAPCPPAPCASSCVPASCLSGNRTLAMWLYWLLVSLEFLWLLIFFWAQDIQTSFIIQMWVVMINLATAWVFYSLDVYAGSIMYSNLFYNGILLFCQYSLLCGNMAKVGFLRRWARGAKGAIRRVLHL